MRRHPSDSAEVPDLSTTHILDPTSTHGDSGTEQARGITQDLCDPVPKREPAIDHAPGQLPLESSYFHATSTSAASASASAPASARTLPSRADKFPMSPPAKDITPESMLEGPSKRRPRLRDPWACSLFTLAAALLGFAALSLMTHSFMTRQLDTKGCNMCYMRPSFAQFTDFDTEHTRFASKYSLYLYREGGIDGDPRVKGVPVLFIPGNAGSYKQVRALGAEAAYHYHNALRHDIGASKAGKRPLDFFTVDFNEDFTAFHGQTMLDQAEYLNDAVTYILSLYHTPSRSARDENLPDPTSVIIVGHSMGGVVARTMVTMPNYQANSINTVITLSAPHARAPVSFDGDIVRTYRGINNYWRDAYSQQWAIDNPLWHLTLISIAGGGLDTVVPSDYATVASIIPETHGFTVFTSSIPNVWTGMDHLAITWCDQLRKSIIRALYDVIDVSRPTQTLPRAERMRGFKKWFLTGLEPIAEKALPHMEAKTLLTLEDDSNAIMTQGERLLLRQLGQSERRPKPYLLPIPPQGSGRKKFTLLTNEKLDFPGEHGNLEVLFCSVFPPHAGHSAMLFSMNMDLSGHTSGSTRLACKTAASDVVPLPASTRQSTFPFESSQAPFAYLQYDVEDLAEHQFVAVVDKSNQGGTGWVIAEFSEASESVYHIDMGLPALLSSGLHLQLPARRPLVNEVRIPALHSSLLAYKFHVAEQTCSSGELFAPLLRQYVTDAYESKFFVNVKDANINLHGIAPYMPPPYMTKRSADGLSLQIWSDPACDSSLEISLEVDILGSIGKLWMRYRIVFAAFPLLVVALVLRHQFRIYDETAIFMSFAESLNQCLRSSIPLTLAGLTFLSVTIAGAQKETTISQYWPLNSSGNVLSSILNNTDAELLLGSEDNFFWFLVPLFGLMCVGICIAVNYVLLGITYLFAMLYSALPSTSRATDEGKRSPTNFGVTSTQQRVITTCILLSLVSTVIPYHFAYVVLCIVQIATCVRGCRLARESRLDSNYNFYNYTHSILVLLIWILPINLPVLVVWVRNLAVHWLTPFSSHHNILAIMPIILLVETQSTGRMIPRLRSRFSLLTSFLLVSIAGYAAVYGVSYAYVLHYLANILCAWLVSIHFDTSILSVKNITTMLQAVETDGQIKKNP